MTERVNIQYSVKLDDLPELIVGMLDEVCENIHLSADAYKASRHDQQMLEYDNYTHSIDTINQLRLALADADYRLGDCVNMLEGLTRMKLGNKEHESTEEQGPLPPVENRIEEIDNAVLDARSLAAKLSPQAVEAQILQETEEV